MRQSKTGATSSHRMTTASATPSPLAPRPLAVAEPLVALTIGVTYGAVAGFFGGKLDAVMMRAVDIMYSLPFAIFVILLMVFFGRNIVLLFVAIGAVEWLTMARIVRSQVMAIK